MSAEFTHAALCDLAVKWLRRPPSSGGHGCHIAVSECRSGWDGEIPDAIGFRAAGHNDGSIVVEVKVSRSDFLSDKSKPHRQPGAGMGNWRYFMSPEGIIREDDLPTGWGLLAVNSRGHIKALAGPAVAAKTNWREFSRLLEAFRNAADSQREQWLLVKLLNRVGDPQMLNEQLRQAYASTRRLTDRCAALEADLKKAKAELYVAKRTREAA